MERIAALLPTRKKHISQLAWILLLSNYTEYESETTTNTQRE